MPTQTDRDLLPVPVLADPADLPAWASAVTAILKKAALYDQGPLDQRPTSTPANPGIVGRRYLATNDFTSGPDGTEYLDIGTGWIKTLNVPDGSVTNAKLTDDSVDERVLAPASVGTPELQDSAVSTAKIAAKAVDGGKIADALKPSVAAGAGTEALRALGTTAGTALSGTDSGTARPPTLHAAAHRRVAGALGADQIPEIASPGWQDVLQPGVMASGDCVVGLTLNANGTIGTGNISGGVVWIPDSTGFLRRHIAPSVNLFSSPPAGYPNVPGLPAPGAGNYDYVLLKLWATYNDWGLGPTYQWTYSNLINTPNVYTTLEQAEASAMGTPANPDGRSVCIFEFLMRSAAGVNANWTSITFRDRRPWAQGGLYQWKRIAGNMVVASGSNPTLLDAGSQIRMECSGRPVRLSTRGEWTANAGGIPLNMMLQFRMDGAGIDVATANGFHLRQYLAGLNQNLSLHASWVFIPPVGSHLFAPYVFGDSGTTSVTVFGDGASSMFEFAVEELRQPALTLGNGTS